MTTQETVRPDRGMLNDLVRQRNEELRTSMPGVSEHSRSSVDRKRDGDRTEINRLGAHISRASGVAHKSSIELLELRIVPR